MPTILDYYDYIKLSNRIEILLGRSFPRGGFLAALVRGNARYGVVQL
jgi:hypothetical protein